jgi:hypothetical protein
MISQALISTLKAKGLGLRIHDRQLVGVFFADDAELLIKSVSNKSSDNDYANFGDATGQRLHYGKTSILPIGVVSKEWTEKTNTKVHGIAIRPTAKALGFTFKAWTQNIEADWTKYTAQISKSYDKIQRLYLSTLGGGIISQTFIAVPIPPTMTPLSSW